MTPTKLALVLSFAAGSFVLGHFTSPQETATASVTAPTRGPHHAALDDLAGDFDARLSMWITPGAAPLEFRGRSRNRWILDGRFLEQDLEADFLGTPFLGRGLVGYSDLEGGYQTLWIDNTSNEQLFSAGGRAGEEGEVLVIEGEEPDALLGRRVAFRDVTVLDGPGRHRFTKYRFDEDGSEVKLMEITSTRSTSVEGMAL